MVPSSDRQSSWGPPGPVPLLVVALATALALVVFTAPLTTLDAMTRDLALGPGAQAWVMSAMPLGAASGLLAAGALGDTSGRRRIFVMGLGLTAISSIAAGLAPSGPVLVVLRIVQGLGSAGIMACGLGLLGQVYRGAVLASLLMELGGWRAIHAAIAVAAALLAVSALRRLPESQALRQRVDLAGSVLLMFGMAALMAALIELRVGTATLVTGLIGASLVLLLGFIAVERRASNAILDLGLFRNPGFVAATLAAFASGAGVLALMSLAPTLMVRGFDLPPLSAAILTTAWSGVTIFAALWGGRLLPAALSAQARVVTALAGCGLGQALLYAANGDSGWAILLPGLLVSGLFNGILNASLGHAALLHVPDTRAAMGSAANNTARYLGSALGISLISIAITGGEGLFQGWHLAVIGTTIVSLVGAGVMIVMRRGVLA
ncbi:MFS transporter [Pararhodobacter sp. CCB-MM2]|uniref:MFS transporter n=1 Tax=Pararhodobacter sp. CCB-MM2 TaxID=1786003 RepID=UPI000833744A|nr:MFS transporter [Pararhodobacter sp. CCB-MM2]